MPEVDLAAAIHKARHAAGGPDEITPADIGAAPTGHTHDASEVGAIGARTATISEGSADDLIEPGTYFINGVMTPANGWPSQPNRWGTAVVTVDPSNRVVQWAVSNGGENVHVRYFGTGNAWYPWKRLDNVEVTVDSIGAFSKFGPTYTGHVDDLRQPGAYRASGSSMNASNGYPWTPDNVGYVIVHGYSSAYVTQEVISETGTVWRRNSIAGSTTAWRSWTPVAVDTGWRSFPLENGWTGNLYLRWRNGYVTITVSNLNGSAAANSNLCTNIGSNNSFYAGAGKPVSGIGNTGSSASAPSGSDVGSIGMTGGTYNSILRASAPNAAWTNGHASVTFPAMNDTLPQPLPGTPA